MPEEKESTALAPQGEQVAADDVLVTAIESEGSLEIWPARKSSKWATNLNPETDEEKSTLVACQMKADQVMETVLNTWIQVKHWFAHKVELKDTESGELREATRLVLMSPEGTTTSTVSGPFANGWRFVLQVYGNGPYDPPIEVKPYKVPGRNNPGGYYQFRVRRGGKEAELPAPEQPKPKVKVRTKDNPTGD